MDLEIWGDLAHVAANNLMQGDQIQVVGKLKKNTWTTREGAERRDVSISLTNINRIVDGMASQDFAGQGVVRPLMNMPAQGLFECPGHMFLQRFCAGSYTHPHMRVFEVAVNFLRRLCRVIHQSFVDKCSVNESEAPRALITIQSVTMMVTLHLQPWDAVPQDAENYDQSRGTDFEEDQTQGLSGWGNEQPSYASSAPAQRVRNPCLASRSSILLGTSVKDE